jgi:tetratricopeptide (TPR) repeat protein
VVALSAVTLAVCGWFFVGTYLRNVVWQEQLLLWEDTVRKSPEFPIARNEYGIALMGEKRYDEAKEQFEKAIELGYRAKPLENLALMASSVDQDHEEAEGLLRQAIEGGGKRGRLYSRLATNYVRRASDESNPNSNDFLRTAISLYEQAYAYQGDPVAFYRIGQVYLRLREYKKAQSSFERAIEKGGPDDFFVAPSKTIVGKLASQRG